MSEGEMGDLADENHQSCFHDLVQEESSVSKGVKDISFDQFVLRFLISFLKTSHSRFDRQVAVRLFLLTHPIA